jgi:hypothetical protein
LEKRLDDVPADLFFAINMIVAALRFMCWDFGLLQREQERLERLGAHRRSERIR